MEENIKRILFLIIAIAGAILLVHFILWLLPIILIGFLAYYIYAKLTQNKVTKIKKGPYKSKNKKTRIIIEEEK